MTKKVYDSHYDKLSKKVQDMIKSVAKEKESMIANAILETGLSVFDLELCEEITENGFKIWVQKKGK